MKIKMAKKAELCLFCVKFEVPLLSRVRYAARQELKSIRVEMKTSAVQARLSGEGVVLSTCCYRTFLRARGCS